MINDVSVRPQSSSLLGDANRKEEVRRLAQGVAAEHFAGQLQQGQQSQNGNFAYQDSARISDEAIEELSKSGKVEDIQRSDQLVSALRQAFDMNAWMKPEQEGTDAQSGNDGGTPEVGGVEGPAQKQFETTETRQWDPTAAEGQIHNGQEVIGKITVKRETKEVDAASQGGSGSTPGGNGAPGASTPTNGSATNGKVKGGANANGSGNSAAPQANKETQKSQDERGKNEKEGAAMAQNLKSAGLQAGGFENYSSENAQQAGSQAEEFDVRSPATGMTQTLTIRDAGELGQGGQSLGTYKKLDDKPALKYVSLHSRGQSLEQTAQMYAQEAKKEGASQDEIVQGVEQLQKTTPDEG